MAILINNMALPDIPSDVLAISPYVVVLTTVSGGNTIYVLAVTNSSVFHGTGSVLGLNIDEGIGSFGAGATYYTTDSTAWNALGTTAAGEFYTALGVQADGSTISLAWSNHNIHELTSYDATTGEYTTGSIWYAKSVDGAGEEELVATHCYYNTVLLPVIPEDVLKTHPYCWIRTNSQTGHYDLLLSSSPWWQADSTTITTANYAEGIQWYRVLISGSDCEWNFHQKWTEGGDFSVDANRPVLWANHNIPVGSVSASSIYFHGSTPVPVLESYDIRRDTLACIANQVRRLCCTTESLTPARMKRRLEDLNIELQPAQVTSSDEEQVIYPDEGYYGFSSITVGAVQTGGGTGGEEGDKPAGPAEDTTFGDEYAEEEVETGLLDYTGGKDEDAIAVPPIPDGDFQLLLRKTNVGTGFTYMYYGEAVEIKTTVPAAMFCVYGHVPDDNNDGRYSEFGAIYLSATEGTGTYSVKYADGSWGGEQWFGAATHVRLWMSVETAEYGCQITDRVSGIPLYDAGTVTNSGELDDAAVNYGATARNEKGSSFIAIVSSSQITFDGTNVSNVDGSPMTIYECTSEDRETWVEIGQTDGDYSADGYELTWNSHDLLDSEGKNVTYEASDAPVAEKKTTEVYQPADRNETYTIDGNTLNSVIGAAQKVTGNKNPMTPEQAAQALDSYQTNAAEEMVF